MSTLRIAMLGIGNRALPKVPEKSNFLGWVEQIARTPHVSLVAAQDPDESARARMTERGHLNREQVFASPEEMLSSVQADALLVCSPAPFHAAGVRLAADAGLHVLVEKPVVTDLKEGERLVSAIERAGVVSTVVQNWRYKDVGRCLHDNVASGNLGRIGHIFFRYVRNRENINYPKYIFKEDYPMLYAMGSHHLDLFRHVLGEEIITIRGESFTPPWSMYESWTGHSITMKTESGVFITYTGTVSSHSQGLPQESLVIEGENGTLANDSDWSDPPVLFYAKGEKCPVDLTREVTKRTMRDQYDIADRVILEDFAEAIRLGRPSSCPIRDSLRSLALVDACRQACESGKTVTLKSTGTNENSR